MQISQDGLNLITSFEGCRLQAYSDVAGVPTIGYGHTAGVTLDMVITQEQATEFLYEDVQQFVGYVNAYVTAPVTQHQFDALVDFTYNLGPGTLHRSDVLAYTNMQQYQAAADCFLKYGHAGGVEVDGLLRRREAERALFLTPDSPPAESPQPTVASNGGMFGGLFRKVFRRA